MFSTRKIGHFVIFSMLQGYRRFWNIRWIGKAAGKPKKF